MRQSLSGLFKTRAVITTGTSSAEFAAPTRIQTNMLAVGERKLLDWLCSVTPASLNPDHFTALGLIGAFLTGAGFALASWRLEFFLLAVVGLALNWLGDSLDGSLARFRGVERPQYGYYVDHLADVIYYVLTFAGIALSPYVRADVALFALVGCLLLWVQVLLANHVEGQFHLSFARLGPTELRLVLMAFALLMYFNDPVYVTLWGVPVTTFTIFAGILGLIFAGLFVKDAVTLGRRLAKADPRPAQRMS